MDRMRLGGAPPAPRASSIAALIGYAILNATLIPGTAAAQAPAQPIAVRVVQPARHDFARATGQPATAEAFFEADLGAKVSGHVTELRVDIGTRVKAGQTLARIAAPELIQARNAAAAEVAGL